MHHVTASHPSPGDNNQSTGPSKNGRVKLIQLHTCMYQGSPLFPIFRALSRSLHPHSSVAQKATLKWNVWEVWLECRELIVRNQEVRRRAGIERELESRADQRVLRWFGRVERMDEYRMARRVLIADVSGRRVRGRPRLGWIDGVKVALGNRGMTVEAARQWAKDRKALVHM